MRGARDKNINIAVGLALLAAGCKKPYTPPAVAAPNNYLVIEGIIAAGQDSTVITLNRSVNIGQKVTHNPELGATVTVQSDQNTAYALTQTDSGRYAAPPLNLDNNHKYKLVIKTADGRTYESDYEPIVVTPAIDTLRYEVTASGLNFFTNTHDPANKTHFYRWDYAETYMFLTPLISLYKYIPYPFYFANRVISRKPSELIHTCYVTLNSSTIILNSSAKLQADVIADNPITQIPSSSEKIYYRYSIIVRQYALTQKAYEFWTLLKKNTEQLGTIFDAQPSGIIGNLHCTSDPKEPVIGYVSAGTISKKRIFIDRTELPVWPFDPPQCKPSALGWKKKENVPAELADSVFIPLGPIITGYDPLAKDSTYSVSVGYYDCVNCTYHLNGKTQKPDFWK